MKLIKLKLSMKLFIRSLYNQNKSLFFIYFIINCFVPETLIAKKE